MEKNQQIEISTSIVFKTILILLAVWLLYLVLDVVALVFIAVIITSAMDPLVDYFQRKKISRSISVLGLFLVLFIVLGFIISFIVPPLVSQFQDFSQNFPDYFQSAQVSLSNINNYLQAQHVSVDLQRLSDNLAGSFSGISTNILSQTVGVFSGFISIVVVFSLAFYMTVEEDGIKKFIISVTPDRYKIYSADLTTRVKEKIGKWMLGQLLLMAIIFVLDSAGLYLVGVPYALVLGFFAGALEIIPYVGPIISAVPGIILGFLVSPTTGFLAALVYLISQQLESNLIVPQVMKKAVGLNPVATIVALLVGARLGGVLGAILSIPVATAISLFLNDLMERKKFDS